jgi:DNA-binding response OmpR family regulator
MCANILVVEDEPRIAALVRAYLERDGHAVHCVHAAAEARAALAAHAPDLMVLDLTLPDGDGLQLAAAAGPATAVVMLTARAQEPERMAGFAAGADDYVPKPFSPRELSARVRAVLRRSAPQRSGVLTSGRLRVDLDAREAWLDERPLALTAKELELLAELVAHAGVVLGRDALLERVWGFAAPGATRTVDQHVAQLRQKLGEPELIQTLRGVGYKLARS